MSSIIAMLQKVHRVLIQIIYAIPNIQEPVNHSYLEQERDEETRAKQYVYIPLVDGFDEEEQQETRRGNW